MKILFIAPRYTGGIGGHAARVAEKLRESGLDVKLMDVPHLPIKKLKNPTFALLGILQALIGNETYDVVHAFNVPSAFVMRYVKAKKKVLSVHGVYSEQVEAIHSNTTAGIVKIAESHVLKWADKLTTDSKMIQKVYKEKLGLNFEFMFAPLDTSNFKDLPEVTKIENQVVYIGRDSFEKGTDILRNIELVINGKVVYCTNVEWKKAMVTLKSSNVLVVPSRIESIPQVIKEAFYLQVPVVATNVGGIPEIITHNVNGLLVPPNDPKKLTEAINFLLENKQYAKKLADAGYEFVMKNLTWEVLLPKYIEFYKNLIKC